MAITTSNSIKVKPRGLCLAASILGTGLICMFWYHNNDTMAIRKCRINRFSLQITLQMTISFWVDRSPIAWVFQACRAGVFGLAVSALAAQTESNPPPKIVSVSAYRAEDERLAFQVELPVKPDPARLRILLDVGGRNHGEPNSGADYMQIGRAS